MIEPDEKALAQAEEAKALQAQIDAILNSAKAEPWEMRLTMGAIDWSNLFCVDIVQTVSLRRPDRITAIIARASPYDKHTDGLIDYVQKRLPRDDVFFRIEGVALGALNVASLPLRIRACPEKF